jgi:hypothetical protein
LETLDVLVLEVLETVISLEATVFKVLLETILENRLESWWIGLEARV